MTAPVIDIVCRYDTRTADYGFSIIGPPLNLDDTIQILEKGLDELRMLYIEQKNKEAEENMDAPDKMKGSSGHKSSKIELVQNESEENKEKREEAEEETAEESTPDGDSDAKINGN